MDIEALVKLWLRWRHTIDRGEINRATGVKSSGIEYRIMREAGVVLYDPKEKFDEQAVMDFDRVFTVLSRVYQKEMLAVETYYLRRKTYRSVRVALGCSQYASRGYVERGELLIEGAWTML